MPTPDGHIGSRDLCSGAVVERTIADGGVSSLKISATLQSDNWNGSVGWQIDRVTGSANFLNATIRGTLNANDITTGYIDASVIDVRNLNATEIKTGSLSADRIATTALNASNISSGSMSADYISGGTVTADILYGGSISGNEITITDINATNINTGTLSADRINVSVLSSLAGATGNLDVNGWLTTSTGGGFRTGSGGNRVEMRGDSVNYASWYYNNTRVGYIWTFQTNNLRVVGTTNVTVEANNQVYVNGVSGVNLQYNSSTKLSVNSSGANVTGRMDVSSYLYASDFYASSGGAAGSPSWAVWGQASGMYSGGGFTGLTHSGSAVITGNGSNQLYANGVASGTGNDLQISGTQIVQVTSSARYKEDISPVGFTPGEVDTILDWQPSSFRYIDGDDTLLGYIAEQIYDASGEQMIRRDSDGLVDNTDRVAMLVLAVEKIKDLHRRVAALEGAA